ncbi:vanadium-dependent haloperoxidase [Brevibacillus dissolubilis]|uniref:vanadium-dependent haloperoxidase n=1 Tax=Brevibacillus dissolubilis TaxID=1844116 RepID=UPI001116FC32|nr:vanadium-dependent haloperoxidase [Brevibacillus dissolubilis]
MTTNNNIPRRWSQLAYAGESRVPVPAVPNAGSWPLVFLGRNAEGQFTDPQGQPITFELRHPDSIDFAGAELTRIKQTLADLTPKQIAIAKYWGQGTPTKQWTPIIDRLIDTYGLSAPHAARLLAAVHGAIQDAFVVTWHYKYLWDSPRPNQLDQNLATILCTPKHPSYPSGHSTISGCAAEVLSYYFPTEREKLLDLAKEASVSRNYAGIHFYADCEQGLRLGRQIGQLIVSALKQQADAQSLMIDIPQTTDRNAKLMPPPYRQALPYPYQQKCSSKLDWRGEDEK